MGFGLFTKVPERKAGLLAGGSVERTWIMMMMDRSIDECKVEWAPSGDAYWRNLVTEGVL